MFRQRACQLEDGRIHTRFDARLIFVVAKMRQEAGINDPLHPCVPAAGKPGPQLNPHLAVIGGDQNQNTVVPFGVANTPLIEQACRKRLDRSGMAIERHAVDGQHRHFDIRAAEQGYQLAANASFSGRIKQIGVVVDI